MNEHERNPEERAFELRNDRLISRRRVLAAGGGLLASALPLVGGASSQREQIVEALLDNMTLKRKVAQLFVFQAAGAWMTPWFEGQLTSVRPGGVIINLPNIGTATQMKDFVTAIHKTNRWVPPYVGIDQEGGNVLRLWGDPAPGAMVLGQMSGDETRAKSRDRARFLAGYGFDVNFAPVADVAYQSSSTMYLRSFGNDPNAVASSVTQFVRGSRQLRVMGAAKHFPGHGRTAVDSHYAIPEVDLSHSDWSKTDALPFKAAVDAGVEMVMVGHLKFKQWDDQPMSLSKVAVETLRKELGFDRVIVTDDLGMGALAGRDPFDVLDRATDAGMDVMLYTAPPASWQQMIDHVTKRVEDGAVSRKRINASVRRILRLKVDHFGLTLEDES